MVLVKKETKKLEDAKRRLSFAKSWLPLTSNQQDH